MTAAVRWQPVEITRDVREPGVLQPPRKLGRDRTKTRDLYLDKKAELRAAVVRMLESGVRRPEVAAHFGLTRARIRQIWVARSRGGATV